MDNSDIHILVVDDDPDILLATARLLQKEGYEVLGAETGSDCLEKTAQVSPDLILLDVQLPDILGTEVCLQLKNNPEHQKKHIVMMSGVRTSSDDQADGLDVGADGYIARPVSNRELLSRVAASVRLIRVERKCYSYIAELEQAKKEIKVLSGILPICMHCKQIRDDKGYWNRIENFIQEHSDAKFSHSICESCLEKYYPEEN